MYTPQVWGQIDAELCRVQIKWLQLSSQSIHFRATRSASFPRKKSDYGAKGDGDNGVASL